MQKQGRNRKKLRPKEAKCNSLGVKERRTKKIIAPKGSEKAELNLYVSEPMCFLSLKMLPNDGIMRLNMQPYGCKRSEGGVK